MMVKPLSVGSVREKHPGIPTLSTNESLQASVALANANLNRRSSQAMTSCSVLKALPQEEGML